MAAEWCADSSDTGVYTCIRSYTIMIFDAATVNAVLHGCGSIAHTDNCATCSASWELHKYTFHVIEINRATCAGRIDRTTCADGFDRAKCANWD